MDIPTEEIGDLWQIEGVVYGNGQQSVVLELPFSGMVTPVTTESPTTEQWQEFLKQADDPVTQVNKAFVRKATRQIDEGIKWKVYKRDNYTCLYCGISGIPMTVDHYLAQALGGITTLDNLRTSCRRCNKRKANMTITEWQAYAESKGLKDGSQITA